MPLLDLASYSIIINKTERHSDIFAPADSLLKDKHENKTDIRSRSFSTARGARLITGNKKLLDSNQPLPVTSGPSSHQPAMPSYDPSAVCAGSRCSKLKAVRARSAPNTSTVALLQPSLADTLARSHHVFYEGLRNNRTEENTCSPSGKGLPKGQIPHAYPLMLSTWHRGAVVQRKAHLRNSQLC
ncbi:hypothetical protein Anapl_06130 [Anas platyrhynchos]|uniref:Uncharacterized protein n=1 Tax=Anas platyrhynchos TaxID=8839 RepID=R0JIM7_ANAPL|nr:hypothetical protein Anapl_06130 [Anas platyrhynchos]